MQPQQMQPQQYIHPYAGVVLARPPGVALPHMMHQHPGLAQPGYNPAALQAAAMHNATVSAHYIPPPTLLPRGPPLLVPPPMGAPMPPQSLPVFGGPPPQDAGPPQFEPRGRRGGRDRGRDDRDKDRDRDSRGRNSGGLPPASAAYQLHQEMMREQEEAAKAKETESKKLPSWFLDYAQEKKKKEAKGTLQQ